MLGEVVINRVGGIVIVGWDNWCEGVCGAWIQSISIFQRFRVKGLGYRSLQEDLNIVHLQKGPPTFWRPLYNLLE